MPTATRITAAATITRSTTSLIFRKPRSTLRNRPRRVSRVGEPRGEGKLDEHAIRRLDDQGAPERCGVGEVEGELRRPRQREPLHPWHGYRPRGPDRIHRD